MRSEVRISMSFSTCFTAAVSTVSRSAVGDSYRPAEPVLGAASPRDHEDQGTGDVRVRGRDAPLADPVPRRRAVRRPVLTGISASPIFFRENPSSSGRYRKTRQVLSFPLGWPLSDDTAGVDLFAKDLQFLLGRFGTPFEVLGHHNLELAVLRDCLDVHARV